MSAKMLLMQGLWLVAKHRWERIQAIGKHLASSSDLVGADEGCRQHAGESKAGMATLTQHRP